MISTKGRYGLRVMIDLAEHQQEGCVPLKEIAARQEISKKYLEIIVRELVSANLIEGLSGKGGGYRLTRPAADYTAGEILEAMEQTLVPVACLKLGAELCPRKENCKTLPLWTEYSEMVHNFFYGKKLTDLL